MTKETKLLRLVVRSESSAPPCVLIQTAHQEFSSLKQSNSEANNREEVLKKLASAHDSYVEISNNLSEGTKVPGPPLPSHIPTVGR